MGKSIRSKRMKKLRSLKREKLAPREEILLEQRAAILSIVKGESVDESAIPQLPEDANAPKRFVHTRDGSTPKVQTLKGRYGYLTNNNTCLTKFNTLAALSERYDKKPTIKVEPSSTTSTFLSSKLRGKKLTPITPQTSELPGLMTRRRSGRAGRDRTEKAVTGSSTIKEEQKSSTAAANEDDEMADAPEVSGDAEEDPIDIEDIDRDQIRYGEFGKPAHTRRSIVRSKLSRKRSKSVGKNGFLNWHNMAASS